MEFGSGSGSAQPAYKLGYPQLNMVVGSAMLGYGNLPPSEVGYPTQVAGYPPQDGHAVLGYGYPPPHAAGYGYAWPPVQKPQKKKKKFGLGFLSKLATGWFCISKLFDADDAIGLDEGGAFEL